MQAKLRSGADGAVAIKPLDNIDADESEVQNLPTVLVNRAGDSKSPYVRKHKHNPVAWQLYDSEAINLAKKENKLIFISIGYSACHWCHVMERESFENDEIAALLNASFIPIKVDREERPDIDRIYMNYVQATTGSGGWPLNVFTTPELEPIFGGTYWPGPNSSTPQYKDQSDFQAILTKLSTAWADEEARCRQDSAQILKQLKSFAAEGTLNEKGGEVGHGLDIELMEEAYQHFRSTFDPTNGGFGGAPKFPTPSKLSFLLRLPNFPQVVLDVVGEEECADAQRMALITLRMMASGGIHDHIGHGFARYSVTADWTLPHFEKMLYDNAQLLHIYLDAWLATHHDEFRFVVYDIADYLTNGALAAPDGCFYSSEDADSHYQRGDVEKREGAFYVWTWREFEAILGERAAEICAAYWGVLQDGNVSRDHDAHDEFINQNVLSVVSSPQTLATQFGMSEDEVVTLLEHSKHKLRRHRAEERPRPLLDDKIITGWNGLAIGGLARAGGALRTFDPEMSSVFLHHAMKAADFIKTNLWVPAKETDNDESKVGILYRVWREGRGSTRAFAEDYAYLIEGLLDLYEATFEERWLYWADELMRAQIYNFHDSVASAFYSTAADAPHTILRLKDGMDSSEPSTNGTSACNLFRLASLLSSTEAQPYGTLARSTLASFEPEIMEYPWLFATFMPAVVASRLGVRSIILTDAESTHGNPLWLDPKAPPPIEGSIKQEILRRIEGERMKPRGALKTITKVDGDGGGPDGDWLRQRNKFLSGFTGGKGAERIVRCEDGNCIEEHLHLGRSTEIGQQGL